MSEISVPRSRRRGPVRWLIALLSTVLLVVAGSGLVAFAQSGSGTSKGPAFVPADAAVYLSGRLDMPAGQGEALAEFLSAFPGLADSGSFDLKADELMDDLVEQISGGAFSYTDDLETFVTGEVGLAMLDLAEAAMSGDDPAILAGIAISDMAAAQSFLELMAASATETMTEESYGSTVIMSDDDAALAVTDEWILLAQTVDQVKEAIDVLDGVTPSLADDPQFATAFARVPAGYLAAAYLNIGSLTGLIELAGAAGGVELGGLPMEDLIAQLPTDMTAYLAAGPDRMTLEAFITPAEATMAFTVGDSDLAAVFPADTQLYVEARDLGGVLETTLTGLFETMPEEDTAGMAPIEAMLGTSLPSFLDFVSDAAVGASLNSDGLWLGMAAEVTDPATAATRVDRLLSLVRLLGSETEGVSIDEVRVGETTVNVITLPIDEALGDSGVPIPIGDTISVAVADDMLLLGTGDFVVDALAADPADSLALSPGYVDALAADTSNAGVLYANISALLTQVEPMLGFMVPEWPDIAPYATALDRMIAVGNVDEVISSRITVIVNQ